MSPEFDQKFSSGCPALPLSWLVPHGLCYLIRVNKSSCCKLYNLRMAKLAQSYNIRQI